MRALGDFFQRQRLAAEKFFEQFIILLSRGFFQRFMRLVKLRAQLRRYIRLRCSAQIQHLAKAGFLAERHLKRNAIFTKHLLNLFDHPEEIAIFFIEFADKNQPGLFHRVEQLPNSPRADFHTGHAIHHDNRRVRRANRRHRVAVKIGKTRRVEQTDLVVLPLAVKRLRVNGALAR